MKRLGSVHIKKFEDAEKGYKVLVSWRRPAEISLLNKIDLWIPEISPSLSLMRKHNKGIIDDKKFISQYNDELLLPEIKDYIKIIALLSLKRDTVLLYDGKKENKCINRVIKDMILKFRNNNDFILDLSVLNTLVKHQKDLNCGEELNGGL